MANAAGVATAVGSLSGLSIATIATLPVLSCAVAMTDPDLKELDDLLPEDLVAMIEANREFFRALYTGIPEAAYRVYH